ncbi:MAG: AAA family ATPase [Planctomycetaceae bacterium]|nr:AAA family ATPase [Planctomycetaceae bacterium]
MSSTGIVRRLPSDLVNDRRCLVYTEDKASRDRNGKVVDGSRPDPSDLMTYDEAVGVVNSGLSARTRIGIGDDGRPVYGDRPIEGVGIAFEGSGLVGIDLDSCIDTDGTTVGWASDVLSHLNTYSEISRSGKGVKCIAKCDEIDSLDTFNDKVSGKSWDGDLLVGTDANKNPEIMVCRVGFFALTGNVLDNFDSVREIHVDVVDQTVSRSNVVASLVHSSADDVAAWEDTFLASTTVDDAIKHLVVRTDLLGPSANENDGSQRLLDISRHLNNGRVPRDVAIESILTYFGDNPDHGNPNWSESYVERKVNSNYDKTAVDPEMLKDPTADFKVEKPAPKKKLLDFGRVKAWSDITASPELDWILQGIIPRRKFGLLSAKWKLGKSTFFRNLFARAERGGEFLGREVKPFKVLVLTEEDEDTILDERPDYATPNVQFLPMYDQRIPSGKHTQFVEELTDYVHSVFQADLILIDTAIGVLSIDENDSDAVGELASCRKRLTKGTNSAVVIVAHKAKAGGDDARGSGSWNSSTDYSISWNGTLGNNNRTMLIEGRSRQFARKIELGYSFEHGYTVLDEESNGERELLDAGRDSETIQFLARHTSFATTQKYYVENKADIIAERFRQVQSRYNGS